MNQCWRLDDSRQTLVLGATRDRLAEVVYWGARLPEDEDLTTLYEAHTLDVTGGMLDANPEISICPEATRTFPGQPGLIMRDTDGTPYLPKFCLAGVGQGENSLTLTYTDQDEVVTYIAEYTIAPDTHLIEAQARVNAIRPVHLHWLAAPVFPGPQESDEMIDVAGRWCGEFQ